MFNGWYFVDTIWYEFVALVLFLKLVRYVKSNTQTNHKLTVTDN